MAQKNLFWEALIRRRRLVVSLLTAALLTVYILFIFIVSFQQKIAGFFLTEGLSLCVFLSVAAILTAWCAIMVYVSWANRYYSRILACLHAPSFPDKGKSS